MQLKSMTMSACPVALALAALVMSLTPAQAEDTGTSANPTAVETNQSCEAQAVAQKLSDAEKDSFIARCTVDERPYHENNVRSLTLGTASEWTLSARGLHPFHVHVNPFQHERTGPGGVKEAFWRDTLLIDAQPQKIRSRYLDFDGKFVLHCHILDHEDQGMMEVVEIN